MSMLQIIGGIVLIIFALAIILVVLLQEGHQQGLGAISGGADTFLSKNRARSIDTFLSRWTKFIAIGFFILVAALNVVVVLQGNASSGTETPAEEPIVEVSEAVTEDLSTIEVAE